MKSVLSFPKWQRIMIELAKQNRWISGNKQNFITPLVFYKTMPILEQIKMFESRIDPDDSRVRQYGLTMDGMFVARGLLRMKTRFDKIGKCSL